MHIELTETELAELIRLRAALQRPCRLDVAGKCLEHNKQKEKEK